jgi:hypothetical protein
MVKEIAPGSGYYGSGSPTDLTVMNDTLYFVANDWVVGRELWKTTDGEAGPVLTSLNLNYAKVNDPGFTLTLNGANFTAATVARWNGVDLPSTYVSPNQLTAQVSASKLTAPGVAIVTAYTPATSPSNPRPFYVTLTGAAVGSSDAQAGVNPIANAAGGDLTASATGEGTLSVAYFNSNPAGYPNFPLRGTYMDVHIAPGHAFTQVVFTSCWLNGGDGLYWWNGSAWLPASNQTYNPATQCATVTVDSTTSPSLSDLTGTPFGSALLAGYDEQIYLPLTIR